MYIFFNLKNNILLLSREVDLNMEELRKLVGIVTLFGKRSVKLLDPQAMSVDNMEEKLFINIFNGSYKNDDEAIIGLYGSNEKNYRYRMLKSRLRQRLYMHLFFIEDANRLAKREEKLCLDYCYRGKILLQITEYAIAERLYKKALARAEQYEFTDIVLDCLANLNFIYTQTQEYAKFNKSLVLLKKYKRIKEFEDLSYELYYINKMELHKSVMSRKKVLSKLPRVINDLKTLWKKSQSFNNFYNYYMLNSWYLELVGAFEEKIKDIENCENLLRLKKVNNYRFDSLLNKYSLIYALFRAKKYERGLKLAPRFLVEFNPFSRNWFAYMSNYFLLAMHAGKYSLAVDLILEVDKNIYFKRLRNKDQENWALYKAYLYFLNPKKSILIAFNYQKFISSTPEHSKDKLGHNIALHILQFIYHLKNKDYDQLYYKEGALRKYLSAYLKDPDSQRSRIFFRLLIVIIRADFNQEKAKKKAQNWLLRLKSTPEPGDAYAKVEILPYEELWKLTLKYLA